MFKFIMSDVGPISVLPTVGFFLIFIGVVIWAIFANKSYISHMSGLPLEDQISQKGEE